MLKNKICLGVILSILLILFSANGFAAYYKYTMESGANFYVSIADKADALENHNEIRQILDDLGNLLVHSKRNDLYPKDGSTGGTLTIPNSALALLAAGTKGDILYCSAANVWSKLSIGADNQVLVVSTDVSNWETLASDLLSDVASIAMLDEDETITGNWVNTAHPWAINEGGTNSGAAITDDRVVITSAGAIVSSVVTTTELGLLDGLTGIQPLDATLTAFAGLTIGANEMIYGTGADALSMLAVNATATNKFLRQVSSGVPAWMILEAGDIPDISATYQPLDTALTNISGLAYVSASFIKLTAEDTYIVRTIAEVITDLALDSDDLSDVVSIAMLDEAETIAGAWTIAVGGSIEGVDSTEFGYLDGVTSDIQTQFGLYYLQTQIDSQEEIEIIWGVNLANDSELHTILTLGTASGLSLIGQELSLAINSSTSAGAVTSGSGQASKVWKTNAEGVPGWRTDEGGVAFTFLDASDTPATYTGQGGKFVRVAATEDAVEFFVIAGGGDVFGPATSIDHSIVRFHGTDNKTVQDSLVTIDDSGSINIPAGQSCKIDGTALAISGANSDITSLTGLTTPLAIEFGGTGSVSAGGARTALGLVIGTDVQAEITGTDTHVMFFDGADTPGGEAGFTYIKGTDTLNVVNIVCTAISGTLTGTASVAATGDAAVDFFGAGVDAVTDATTCIDIEGTLLSIAGGTLNAAIPEDHISATMLKDDNAPADEDIFCYELTGTTGHWYSRAELGIGVATSIQDDLIVKADFANEDWGDMTVATNVVTIDSGAITYAKIQNVSATDKVLGRATAGAGVIEEITCTSAGRALIDDADASAQRTTLGLVIGTDVEVDLSNEAGLYAVLSDVALFLEDLIDDTTPELGGQLQAGAHSVNFTEQILTPGTAVAWNLGNSNKATLTPAQNFTITITAPSGALNAQLIVTQDGTGSRIMDEIVTQKDEAISTAEVHTDTEIIDLSIDIPTGARIRFKTSAADLPEPLVVDTIYWAIRSSENHIQVAITKADAVAGTDIDLTDTGTGTHTVQQLVKWPAGTLRVLTTDAGAEDILSLTYKTGDKQWYAQLGNDFQ